MALIERFNLEYKSSISNTFLKTVSAYANYGDGKIIFGVSDKGDKIGVAEADDVCLSIEGKINDSITPMPEYTLVVDAENRTITLSVREGFHKPYYYRNKAYKRSDTSTVEVDQIELNRLITHGMNLGFEELPAFNSELSFNILEKELIDKLGIDHLSGDILRTLDLYYDKTAFNRAAEILADENKYPGIDMVRFGDSIDEFLDRETHENISVLRQFENGMRLFNKYYCKEEIVGANRVPIEIIPEKAFREALANAIVHRLWDMNASIRVSMYDDYVEIVSPGGLPNGLTKSEYLDGQVSLLRNPIITNVFFRLRYIEKFGTGVLRIKRAYKDAVIQPEFKIYANSISIILPKLEMNEEVLNDKERLIFRLIRDADGLSRKEIEEQTKIERNKVIRILNRLIERNIVKKTGQGRMTRYIKA